MDKPCSDASISYRTDEMAGKAETTAVEGDIIVKQPGALRVEVEVVSGEEEEEVERRASSEVTPFARRTIQNPRTLMVCSVDEQKGEPSPRMKQSGGTPAGVRSFRL